MKEYVLVFNGLAHHAWWCLVVCGLWVLGCASVVVVWRQGPESPGVQRSRVQGSRDPGVQESRSPGVEGSRAQGSRGPGVRGPGV